MLTQDQKDKKVAAAEKKIADVTHLIEAKGKLLESAVANVVKHTSRADELKAQIAAHDAELSWANQELAHRQAAPVAGTAPVTASIDETPGAHAAAATTPTFASPSA